MHTAERHDRSLNVGFLSTRFWGLDGVSLEAGKWASTLKEFGHKVFWFAGQLDRDLEASMLVPEAFFGHPPTEALNRALFGARSGAASSQMRSTARRTTSRTSCTSFWIGST